MRALFVCRSLARAGYYRCVLPAMWGGWDWAAVDGSPPGLTLVSSWVNRTTMEPNFEEYDVIVLEQVRGRKWLDLIRSLRSRNIKVLYEIDDYVHGIRHAIDHDFAGFYQKSDLKEMETCMRACDGIIVSTQYLAEKYQRIARDRPVWVCENGLDTGRYNLTRPPRGQVNGRETVTIIWAGATGHQVATLPWLSAIASVMRDHKHVTFVSIGQDFASLLTEQFPDRTMSIPFTSLECYPASMMTGDIAIAPAGYTDWYKAKSTLRAMESALLGIPVVAHKHYASAVLDGETGIIAARPENVRSALSSLVRDDDRRHTMSEVARAYALENFTMHTRVEGWRSALESAVG